MSKVGNTAAVVGDDERTLPHIFQKCAVANPDRVIARTRTEETWKDITWRAFQHDVSKVWSALKRDGFGKGDVGCILAATDIHWLVADAGLMTAGMISAGIYPTEPPERLAYILNDARARILFVDSAEQLEKALRVRHDCPSLERIIVMSVDEPDGSGVYAMSGWLGPPEVDAMYSGIADLRPDDGAILIYTSGTTGPPKGALVPHRAVAWQISNSAPFYYPEPGWVRPAFLPLCHVAERYFTLSAMVGGAISYLVPDFANIVPAIVEMRPHFIVSVPRVYEKLMEHVTAKLGPDHGAGELAEAIAQSGLDRIKRLYSGGAAAGEAVGIWFENAGMPILEMYGMTETGTIAAQLPESPRKGVVGPPCAFSEVRLLPNGEVAVRGRGVFTKYLNKPDATGAAFDGDWFLTGDLGEFDDQGNLRLVGRLKELIITSGGKNVSPHLIEQNLQLSPVIERAIAIGDGRKYVSALIVLDLEQAVILAGRVMSLSELAEDPAVIAAVENAIAEANQSLSRVEQVKRFVIVHRALDPDTELTPTLKVKRAIVSSNFGDLIEDLYRD